MLVRRIAQGDLALQQRGEQEIFEAAERMAARMRQVIVATRAGADPSTVVHTFFGNPVGDQHG